MKLQRTPIMIAITLIAIAAAVPPAHADMQLRCTVLDTQTPTAAPTASTASNANAFVMQGADVANLEQKPHKNLTGVDLMVWNKFCEGQDPKAVYEWRYGRCHGLDPEFAR